MKTFLLILVLHAGARTIAQNERPAIDHRLLEKPWPASWISYPGAGLSQYAIFHFRRSIHLDRAPTSFVIHISADTRYKLFVNGQFVNFGPARSDPDHWKFDTYDLSPYMTSGHNVIAVVVWNGGQYNAYGQFSYSTALIVQGDKDFESMVNTGGDWLVMKDTACSPIVFAPSDRRLLYQYYVAGPTDSLVAARYPWGWEKIDYDDKGWHAAEIVAPGIPYGITNPGHLTLVPRGIGNLENTWQRFRRVSGEERMTIPANQKLSILLDAGELATGYLNLAVSKGRNSSIRISYAEAFIRTDADNQYRWHKGNRDSMQGDLFAVYDRFVPDGGDDRTFCPLWNRTFRFVRLDINTAEDPLIINDVSYLSSHYPYVNEARFITGDTLCDKIDQVAFRTSRLCALETYMDCPYYEQLQYIGDTRLQALYWYYHSSDDRLSRNALLQFHWSRAPEGLTMSRYPSQLPQYTPVFSLCWMLMVRDYWMYRGDENFLSQFVQGMLDVLDWFAGQLNEEGMLGRLPYLDFFDTDYSYERTLQASKSRSLTPVTLFFAYTIKEMRPFFTRMGRTAEYHRYDSIAAHIIAAVKATCYDSRRGLYAENSDKLSFSQHANIMAVLAGCAASRGEKIKLLKTALLDTTLKSCSSYFKFYLFSAMREAGLGAEILHQLGDWQYMLAMGLTTFSEWKVDPRSDCHAWSAHPATFFLSDVAGIRPAEPGFRTIVIEPNPGHLRHIEVSMPHPKGMIRMDYRRNQDGRWILRAYIPPGTRGLFRWKGRDHALHPGYNRVQI